MSMIEIHVPDIGDFKDVPVIEVHVQPGDTVAVEDPLVTLESDKATMEVPCPAGRHGRRGQGQGRRPRLARATVIVLLEAEGAAAIPPKETVREDAAPSAGEARPATARRPGPTTRSRSRSPTSATSRTCRSSRSWSRPATTIAADDPLITLESDKATMDVPSPAGGHGGRGQGQGRRQGLRRATPS